ncbi:gliding motility-associated C-terminal domain-containing protein [Chryseolinea sp. T2]|uniref:gliding motility-associated C-terminal domain-containing protein n=1 Tax=Chryseolinea sp. T2 TaxID=3129255 RepID=UPI003077BCE9
MRISFRLVVPFLVSIIPVLARAQFLENASFEGTAGMSKTPPGWYACKEWSTPDTHGTATNIYGINRAPIHGTTFAGLVTRGVLGNPNDAMTEAIGTPLQKPLQQGQCYKLTVALANAHDMVHNDGWGGIYYYDQPAVLNIYGGDGQCSMAYQLAKSEAIDHNEWKYYSFEFTATSNLTSLVFEADYPGESKTMGNIVLDDIHLETRSIELGEDISVCAGEPVTLMLRDVTDEQDIEWSNGVAGRSTVISQQGIYSVKVKQEHCVLSDSVTINYIPALSPPGNEVISICEGEVSEIGYRIDGASYHWNTGDKSEMIQVTKAGTYAQTVDNGCDVISKTFDVGVDNTCCTVSAPNVFTPNGDNKNDFFEISHGDRVTNTSLQIVNRWGSMVYETSDLDDYWDGNSHGVEISSGVYYWTVVLSCTINGEDVQKSFKGTVTLQRQHQ